MTQIKAIIRSDDCKILQLHQPKNTDRLVFPLIWFETSWVLISINKYKFPDWNCSLKGVFYQKKIQQMKVFKVAFIFLEIIFKQMLPSEYRETPLYTFVCILLNVLLNWGNFYALSHSIKNPLNINGLRDFKSRQAITANGRLIPDDVFE